VRCARWDGTTILYVVLLLQHSTRADETPACQLLNWSALGLIGRPHKFQNVSQMATLSIGRIEYLINAH
jgi:hypothetical protein